MSSRRVATLVRTAAIVLMVGSAIGFIATLVLGAFVLDKYDAYGEVPIPGTSKVHLPAGQVTASFHTVIVGNSGGGGLPVPHLVLDIDPPASIADPKVTENIGSSTSVNGDIHRRVWVVQILTEGDYIITTSGDINGFISPRLAFGRDNGLNHSYLATTATLFFIGLGGTITSLVWRSRATRRQSDVPDGQVSVSPADGPVVIPPDEGVKIEQLKNLAALRDSGALTEKEFQAEKRRVLDGD